MPATTTGRWSARVGLILAISAAVGLVTPRGRRGWHRLRQRARRRAAYLRGSLPGLVYRLRRRQPDPNVSDDVLSQRVRAELGSLAKRLDLPHPHVVVMRRVAYLHGDVASARDADRLERAALAVSGVEGIASHLHVGLLPGDSRPSEGAAAATSSAYKRLHTAVLDAGCPPGLALVALRATLGSFLERIPPGERGHLLAHLPADVRAMARPPRRVRADLARVRHLRQLVDVVAGLARVDDDRARTIVGAVLRALSDLVPEERDDVAAVLPPELRALWTLPEAG